jgi:hypothetical protein
MAITDAPVAKSRLQYPSVFTHGMPFIHFVAYNYNCPTPSVPTLDNLKNKDATGDAVSLYMPGDFSESVNASWSPEDTYQGAATGLEAFIAANVAERGANIDGGKLLASAKAAGGKLPFPTDINIFRSVDPMNLTLSFNMIPYDATEGSNILQIIKTFKRSILPKGNSAAVGGIVSKNAVLNFPAIWDLHFEGIKGIGLENSNTNRYENMCLTNCTVNYTSGTEGASVYHDGTPTQVKMSLSFQSLRKQFLLS